MSKCQTDKIEINGEPWVREESLSVPAEKRGGMKYVICRTYSAGVFAGYMEERNGKEAVMRDARRLWSWQGAASLSQMAMEGTSKPNQCKFPCAVDRVVLTEVIEVLDCTKKAQSSIEGVPIWKA